MPRRGDTTWLARVIQIIIAKARKCDITKTAIVFFAISHFRAFVIKKIGAWCPNAESCNALEASD
jgi:hypothetical protein